MQYLAANLPVVDKSKLNMSIDLQTFGRSIQYHRDLDRIREEYRVEHHGFLWHCFWGMVGLHYCIWHSLFDGVRHVSDVLVHWHDFDDCEIID